MLIGVAALLRFEDIGGLFLFMSPDGVVEPFMLLMLKLLLISLGTVGLVFVFYGHLFKLLQRIDQKIVSSDPRSFLLTLMATGFMLRAAVVLIMPLGLWADYSIYDELGWEWATRGGYYNGELLTAYRPPGYQFFLSRLYLV
ncbi:MAG: hypothetical protein KAW91_06700, partial [candidate division Zixibacteria bacterium]|nr:hypothetical protein [candidate division Zixibacteria bacterium]